MRLGACSYPRSPDRITGLSKLGVTLFVDLTEPEEGLPPYTALLADWPSPESDEQRRLVETWRN